MSNVESKARCVRWAFTKMSASTITPRRLLAFENRTADSRLDDLSSPVSACARMVGLGFTAFSLPHRDEKKIGSEGRCHVSGKEGMPTCRESSQFGCFQFNAAHTSGEKEVNTILLRPPVPELSGRLW